MPPGLRYAATAPIRSIRSADFAAAATAPTTAANRIRITIFPFCPPNFSCIGIITACSRYTRHNDAAQRDHQNTPFCPNDPDVARMTAIEKSQHTAADKRQKHNFTDFQRDKPYD